MRLLGDLNSPSTRNPPLSIFHSVHRSLTSEGSPNLFKAVLDFTTYSPSANFLSWPRSFCRTDNHSRTCGSSTSDCGFAGVTPPGSSVLAGACANKATVPMHSMKRLNVNFHQSFVPWKSENRFRIWPLTTEMFRDLTCCHTYHYLRYGVSGVRGARRAHLVTVKRGEQNRRRKPPIATLLRAVATVPVNLIAFLKRTAYSGFWFRNQARGYRPNPSRPGNRAIGFVTQTSISINTTVTLEVL